MILARYNKQVIRLDFLAFGQVDWKFRNSPVYVGLRQTLVLNRIRQILFPRQEKEASLWLFRM